jgi:hypothetical protein
MSFRRVNSDMRHMNLRVVSTNDNARRSCIALRDLVAIIRGFADG